MRIIRRPSAFESVISAIYRAALDRSLWSEALVIASDYVGASGGLLVFNDLRSGVQTQSWAIAGRLRDDLNEIFLRHYVDNPLTRAILPLPSSTVHTISDLVDPSVMTKTALHADILRPQGIVDMMVLPYARWRRGSNVGGPSFMLQSAGAVDLRRRQRRFEQIAPHLLRALDLGTEAEAVDAARNSLRGLIDAVAVPAMLLDWAGDLVHANPSGEALLREADGLRALGGTAVGGMRLLAARPAESQLLAATIGRAVAAAADPEGASEHDQTFAMRIGRPSGRPDLAICVVPLPVVATAWPGPATIRAALFVLQPGRGGSKADARAAAVLGDVYGLTRAEQRVAALVGAGLGLPETARSLGVSLETARTHLRHVFAKTGTRSQVDLARLLAMFPAGRAATDAPVP